MQCERRQRSNFTQAVRHVLAHAGQIRNAPMKKKKMLIKFYQNAVFTVDDGPPRSVEDPANQAFLEAIKERRVPDELRDEFQDGLDLSIMPMPEDYDPASAPKYASSCCSVMLQHPKAALPWLQRI